MNKKSGILKDVAKKLVRASKRNTHKNASAEENNSVVLTSLRGEKSNAML